MGRKRRRSGRSLSGLFILDKPEGISSNHALQKVKRLFKAEKAGHSGSLDPLATGLLPICFGEATKFSQFLLNADKTYYARAKLGVRTSTGDAEGKVIETRPVEGLDVERINRTLSEFLGEIRQVPPMHSAIKHQGKPLYQLAREGQEVDRASRQINIYRLELLSFSEDEIELEVACSKGTYIRTLVEDIGESLACGAHVSALRRIHSGPFYSEQMHTLESLEASYQQGGLEAIDQLLLPVWTCVGNWPDILLDESSAFYLKQGQTIQCLAQSEGLKRVKEQNNDFNAPPSNPDFGGQAVQIWEKEGENRFFLGVGALLDDGRLAPRRLIRLN